MVVEPLVWLWPLLMYGKAAWPKHHVGHFGHSKYSSPMQPNGPKADICAASFPQAALIVAGHICWRRILNWRGSLDTNKPWSLLFYLQFTSLYYCYHFEY